MALLVAASFMVLTLLQAPILAQGQDPNEGEPKHEIRELKNRLHHTDDPSKQNHIEGRIDVLQGVLAGGT
jgi:hypothetical protein